VVKKQPRIGYIIMRNVARILADRLDQSNKANKKANAEKAAAKSKAKSIKEAGKSVPDKAGAWPTKK
ncbi:MAG: hypothetical protein OEX07_16455, partial [Gammaproteobacteria bacterium]|nr:hypothetical protein [Gammaproteobacteria bacterium]